MLGISQNQNRITSQTFGQSQVPPTSKSSTQKDTRK